MIRTNCHRAGSFDQGIVHALYRWLEECQNINTSIRSAEILRLTDLSPCTDCVCEACYTGQCHDRYEDFPKGWRHVDLRRLCSCDVILTERSGGRKFPDVMAKFLLWLIVMLAREGAFLNYIGSWLKVRSR